ncbi:alpha-galactosidase [Kutzneria buriramensis]|uniref:alpha-galactosidase n=1 Tax=Kutzneria buriramensis TaxID=1045776 RepID=A0A3E0H083_9PSEU|nr:alpha-galactosidase [Kutzneria buriramensis]REH35244.1 alpha-galactosidase [Kutzneria buriramensis]
MSELISLAANGVGLVLETGPGLPRVLHWGADLGPVDDALVLASTPGVAPSSVDTPIRLTVLPSEQEGWLGRPGTAGHREGSYQHVRPELIAPVAVDGNSVTFTAADSLAGVEFHVELHLDPQGVLRVRHEIVNTGADTWTVDALRLLLPVPTHASELLDLTGRWCRERSPQRSPFLHGLRARESRRGRTGHDATGLLVAGTDGFGFRHGEVWGVHLAWSGNHEHFAERLAEGVSVLGSAEILAPGEIRLGPGESYATPWALFVWSDRGLDGLSDRLHAWMRARDSHPSTPRPVVLNTWEAVYFNHDLDRLKALADRAAEIGVERFVLDDGWFLGRRDDSAGLGDWYVDTQVWPDGLKPLVDYVRDKGMQFGLWFEPEMVNPDSELARAHPDWLLVAGDRLARPWRQQQVLNLAKPEVFDYLLERLDSLVAEYRIDYIKWDHNRDLMEAVPGVHGQTAAVYRLLDALRSRHPALEIESCSSGGARVDLGILGHTDRVWASDTNDAVERQRIQRWMGLLVPPELIGSHVGPPEAHTTGRVTELPFRCATALFDHAGLEWDLTGLSAEELAQLTGWIAVYKRLRPLLHGGVTVRADHTDHGSLLHGVVGDGHAVFCYARLETSPDAVPARLRFPGLDPARRYTVRAIPELAPAASRFAQQTPWVATGVTLPGATLATFGLQAPLLGPAQALVLELTPA